MTDEQWERWMRELEKEEPKEWEANPLTNEAGNMFGAPKRNKRA